MFVKGMFCISDSKTKLPVHPYLQIELGDVETQREVHLRLLPSTLLLCGKWEERAERCSSKHKHFVVLQNLCH